MLHVLICVAFLILFFLSHILAVRSHLIAFNMRASSGLAVIWTLMYAIVLLLLPGWLPADFGALHPIWGAPLALTTLAFFALAVLVYLGECNMVEYESPSMTVMRLVNIHPAGKMTRAELLEAFSDQKLIHERLEDLIASNCARLEDGRYHLLPPGERFAKFIAWHRALINRGLGG